MFRERPLTWLFVIATLLLDGVIACNDESRNYSWMRFSSVGFLFGQSMVLGAWLADSKLHRLTRGALFVVGQAFLIFVFELWRGRATTLGLSGEAIAFFSVLCTSTLLATLIGRVLQLCFFKTKRELKRLQFPLIELFGWTIVIALASLLVRQAHYTTSLLDPVSNADYIGSVLVVALMTVLCLPPDHLAIRLCWVVVAAESVYFLLYSCWCYALGIAPSRWELTLQGVIHLYVVLWLAIQRLDYANHPTKVLRNSESDREERTIAQATD